MPDIGKRIRIEQHQVRGLSRFDRPLPAFAGGVEKFGGLRRRRLQRLQRREASLGQQFEFLVETWPRKIEGIEGIGTGP